MVRRLLHHNVRIVPKKVVSNDGYSPGDFSYKITLRMGNFSTNICFTDL